jgi:hypothetical protein
MTKNTFVLYFITALTIIGIISFLLSAFGKLPLPIIHIGTVVLFTAFAFPSSKRLKGIKLLDEREKFLALKILGISTYVFLIILLFIASYSDFIILGHKLNEIWGHFVVPIFLIVLSTVGFFIVWFEERI